MSELQVAKFGGTSMAQPEVVASVAAEHPEQRIIIVSAPGKSPDFDFKMTDVLYYYGSQVLGTDPVLVLKDQDVLSKLEERYATSSGNQKNKDIMMDVMDRFDTIYSSLGRSVCDRLRVATYQQLEPNKHQDIAYYASLGESVSARYFAELSGGYLATANLIRFQDGRLDRSQTRQAVRQAAASNLFRPNQPTIYPGFLGHDQNGQVRLLGRGGSDRTQALFMDGLEWDGTNWTDVDGVFSADPRVIKSAQVLTELTREEVREGAHGGSGVLHGDTILDLQNSQAAITVRNTFNTSQPGTNIVANPGLLRLRQVDSERPVVALSGRNLKELSVKDLGMADQSGYIANLLHRTAELGISIEHLPASQDAATFTFQDDVSKDALAAFKRSVEFHAVSDQPDIQIQEKGVVYVVGEALRTAKAVTGVLGRIGVLLANNDLAFDAVVSHPQSPSLALLVDRQDVLPILSSLHAEFIE